MEEKEQELEKRGFKNWKRSQKLGLFLSLVVLLAVFILLYYFWPRIVLNGPSSLTLSYQEAYQEKGAYATYLWKKDQKVTRKGEVDSTKLGTYHILYSYQNGFLRLKKRREIHVVDDLAPTITLTGGKEVFVCPNQKYEEAGYQATDNYDQDVTDQVKVEVEEQNNIVRYTVEDSSHNKTSITRTLIQEDKTPPTITLKGSQTETIYLGKTYLEDGYQASDGCDGDLTEKVVVEGSVDTSQLGEYHLIYRVTDSSLNETQVERVVTVVPSPSKGDGIIYLTFDDGPSATVTPYLLDILKEENVKVTFFVINHASRLDYLMKRASEEGHTIGLHSYSHNYRSIYASSSAYFQDLKAIHDKVQTLTGIDSKIIRFPGGGSNTVSKFNPGIMSLLTKEVLNQGYHYFDWNVESGDAGGAKTATDVYQNVIKGLRHDKTNIVLLHDFENNQKMLDAIRDIIRYGKTNGYRFSNLTMDTKMVRHNVAN